MHSDRSRDTVLVEWGYPMLTRGHVGEKAGRWVLLLLLHWHWLQGCVGCPSTAGPGSLVPKNGCRRRRGSLPVAVRCCWGVAVHDTCNMRSTLYVAIKP
jgi:hypothetical protein